MNKPKTDVERRVAAKRAQDLANTAVTQIVFQDHGQDFLHWLIDREGNVVDCGPFQYTAWVGGQVLNFTELRVGGQVEYQSRFVERSIMIKYPIKRLNQLEKKR